MSIQMSDCTATSRPPVIILGVGITALGVARILGERGVPAFAAESSDPLVRRSRWFRTLADGPIPDGVSLGTWLSGLSLASAVLIPCSDHWVSEVARLHPSLRTRFPASIPATDTLERFVDKGRFAALLGETGTPHPFTREIDRPADLASIPDRVFSSAILKPRNSQRFLAQFGVKAVFVSSRDDAAIQLESFIDAGHPVILQEYVPGPATNHYFVDGFVDRLGEVRALFVRQRLRMFPLDFGNSTAMVSVPASAAAPAVAAITALLRRTRYRGMFSAEFKIDSRDGEFKLLEVNARAWWYVHFAARCGVDVCQMAVDDALARPVASVATYAVGRRLVFPYLDYFAYRDLRRRGQLSRWSWLRSWFGAMQPTFFVRDPVPGTFAFATVMAIFVVRRASDLVALILSAFADFGSTT